MSKTLTQKIVAAGLAGATAVGLSAGCATNDSALFIRGVLAQTAPQCTVKADPSALMLGRGVLDREFADTYTAALLVGNQLVPRGNANQLRTETSRVRLQGAIVSVSTPGGSTLQSFSTIGTGFVDPGSGDQPGYGVMFATLVPPGTGAAGDVVNVTVRVYGKTLGGQDIESGDLSFPVYICQGCLVRYPADAADPTSPTYRCASTAGTTVQAPCLLGQDDPIDCRLCANDPICVTPP